MTAGTRAMGTTAKPRQKANPPGARPTCGVCGERLSAYNPGPNCYAHTVGVPWRGPNHRA